MALDKDKFSYDLITERYAEAEKQGILFIATARKDGRLIGYYVAAVLPHLHYRAAGPMAHVDMYFLLRKERKGGTGARLLMFVEEQLKAMGITKIYMSCKAHADHSLLFESLGFKLSDYMFTKVL